MAELPLTVNALHESEMQYHGTFGNTIGSIQNIDLMIMIESFYTA